MNTELFRRKIMPGLQLLKMTAAKLTAKDV